MPGQVDPLMPVHPVTVTDVQRMVAADIVDEDDRIELLDGVLVEMSPQGAAHAYAVAELTMLAVLGRGRGGATSCRTGSGRRRESREPAPAGPRDRPRDDS